ncbi:hypothetical protein D3C72_1513830 [compost metagenome]
MDKGKQNDYVVELLKNFRSYEYAANNCGRNEDAVFPTNLNMRLHERRLSDGVRYNRIVNMIHGAVNHVLNDDQRTIIMRKYMERNTMTLNEIAAILHKDRTTIGNWHREAIKRLVIALEPLTVEEREINNIDHMFNPDWVYVEPA